MTDVLGYASSTFHAVSWTWFGASALCIGAGVLLIVFLKQFQAGALAITVGLALGAIGTLYTERNLAREEAKRMEGERDAIQASYRKYQDDIATEAKKAEDARIAKEKHDAEEIQKQVHNLNSTISALRSDRERLARRVLDAQAGADPGSGKVPGVPGTADGTRSTEPAGVPDLVPREAFLKLVADGAETAELFAKCRDSWKAVVGR